MGLLGVSAAMAGVNAAMSLAQYIHNKKQLAKDEANRPQYSTPEQIGQNVNQAQQMSLQGLPEAQKQEYLTNLQRGTAYGLSQIGSRKGGLAGVGTLNEEQNQGYDKLLSQDAAARMQNINTLYGMRNTAADYKNQEFQLNKLNPYYEDIARRNANTGALFQNLSGAVNMFGNQAMMNKMPQGGGLYGGYNGYNNPNYGGFIGSDQQGYPISNMPLNAAPQGGGQFMQGQSLLGAGI